MNNQQVMLHDGYDVSTASIVLDSNKMSTIFKLAEFMSKGVATVPKHLQGNPADCMAVIIQASQWGLNPFAVAQKTHLINGVLGYEAQLVNTVLQSAGFVKGTFIYEYKGDGNNLECRVGAKTKDHGDEILYGEWLKSSDITIKNSTLWKTNPKQQIGYLQIKNWARKYYPGAILGVYTEDEIENIQTQQPQKAIQTNTQNAYLKEIEDDEKEKSYQIPEKPKTPAINKISKKRKLYNLMQEHEIDTQEKINSFNSFHNIDGNDEKTFEHILEDFESYVDDWQNALLSNEVELI
ncbi:RecT family recombinase [Francisella tularensis]|uniref:RecT family recombinase n=1 Tax=Francisella tularensis TaxID=263 RepID=UPI0008F4CEDC|nr:RecT family recombinase [Francisella tularensis]APA83269.1 Gifsy-2 prophage-like protein [Francisella tularensis subsp. novicida PA10-7858]